MISIVIPYYKTKESGEQLVRCAESIYSQTYEDHEVILVEEGGAAHNLNEGIKRALGDIILTIGMDDYFTDKNALQGIVDAFRGVWGAHGVSNNQEPRYTGDIHLGNNKMGGISSIICRKDAWIPMDETMVWLFDCDWHKQMYLKYGEPTILNGEFVTITEGEGQATNIISEKVKLSEVLKMQKKYA